MSLIVNNKYTSYLKQLENSYDRPVEFVELVNLAKTQIRRGKYNTSELLNVWKKLMRGLKYTSESCEQNILCLLDNEIPLLNYAYDYEAFYDFIQYSTYDFYTKLIYRLHKNHFQFDGFVSETKYSISQDFNRNCPLMNCIDLMIKHSKQNTFDSYSSKYEFMLENTKHKTFIIQYSKEGIVRYETPLSIAQVSEPVINILVKYETKSPPNKKCTDCEPCYENFFKINVIQQRKNENKYRKLYDHLKKRKESMKGTSLNGVPNEVDLNAIDEKTMNRRNLPWNHNPNENYYPNGHVRKYPYVVVGGIGGSGGGGGDGGEVINLDNILITNNNNNVIIVGNGGAYGNGGSGTEIYASNGYNGEKSYFNNISANGGYGGNYSTISESGLGGLSGSESSIIPGGGGFGGYENNYGRNGYNGSQVNIGPNLIYYGGGGCGGQNNNNPFLNGGLGGGSSTNVNLGNGVVNTGGGGGGGDYYFSRNTGEHGGNGGSGLVIIYFQYNPTPSIITYEIACPPYKCPETINKKSLNSNADVDQTLTQSARAVNAIRYAPGGKTQYGYSATIYQNSQVTYLGRVEGQPGGIGRLSGRNRF